MKTTHRLGAQLGLAALLAAAASRAPAGQTVTPLELVALASGTGQDAPAVACDGSSYLLAWEEGGAVWAAVLDLDGAVVAPRFAVAPQADPLVVQAAPALAAGAAGGYLVAWAERGTLDWDVRGARISGAGVVLDAAGLDLSTASVDGLVALAPGPQEHPAVAALGSDWLVVWQDGRVDPAAPDVLGALVGADGTVATPDGIPVARSAAAEGRPAVASSGSDFLVAWQVAAADGTDVHAARVSAAGAVSTELVVSSAPADQLEPAVASTGGGYLAVWNDRRSGAWQLMAARIDGGGVLDPAGFAVALLDASGAPAALASDGIGYLSAFERAGAGALGARVAAGGTSGAEFAIAPAAVPPGQALAFAGYGRYLAVHRESAGGVARLAAAFLTTSERLDVTVVGSGTVASTPGGLSCRSACAAELETGTTVTLEATPDAGWRLDGFTGCAPAGSACTATLTAPAAVTVTFVPALPGAPGTPSFDGVTESAVTVAWSEAVDATSYALERAPDAGGPGTYAVVYSGVATSHVDGGLAPNAVHWYRVRGVNAAGPGEPGSAASVLTLPAAPGAPAFSGVTSTAITIAWSTPAGGADGYELERATGAAGVDWTRVAVTASPGHTDDALAPGTDYRYRVRATNATGAGAYSAIVAASTLPAAPGTAAAPTYAGVGETALTVTWAPVTGATGYDLQWAPAAAGAWTTLASGIAAATHADTGLTANTTRWYRVRAVNTGGAGPYSPASSVTTLPGVPGTPATSGVTAASVTLAWTAPASGAAGYAVERASAAGLDWAALATVATPSYTDATVSPDTTYLYRVRATNATGAGAPSAAVTVTTLPLPPGTAAAPGYAGVGETALTVTWPPAAGATGYDLQWAPAAAGAWTTLASGIAATTHSDTGLTANTTRWYRVRALNAGGAAPYSAASSVTTLPAAPGTLTFSAVSASAVTVSWLPPAGGASTYRLERRALPAGAFTELAAGLTGTTRVDGGLAPNAAYAYRVRATNATGDGAYSAAAEVVTLAGAPGAPSFSTVTASSLLVTWAPPTGGATSYTVERASAAAGPFAPIATVAASSAPDAGLLAGTRYWYRVVAVTAAGTSQPSVASEVITLPPAPGAPSFSSVGATAVTVGWAPATGAASYKLERAVDPLAGPWTQLATGLTGTSYASTGLAPNTRYWYRVRATNASGDGELSATGAVLTLPGTPGVPSFAAITTSSLTVAWTAPTGGASGYDLERGASATGPWTVLAPATGSGTFADAGLAAGTTYWYRVRALNADGVAGAYATASVPTVPDAPAAPRFASLGATSVDVSWPPVTGATQYRLERALDDGAGSPGPWVLIATVGTASYASTGLVANETYWFRLRASNASGTSAYSPAARVTTLPTAPGTPRFAAVTETGLAVSWTAPPEGAASYVLERALASSGPWTAIGGALTATSFTDGGLTAGTTYWYRVRAVNVDGGVSGWSIAASVPTLPVAPGAPTFTGLSTVAVTVSWGAVAGATTYHLERAPDAAGAPGAWTVVAAGLTDTFFHDALDANTAWWYRVRAANASGYGTYSPAASVTTLANPPGRPTFTNLTPGSVTVSWTASAGGASGYVLQRAAAAAGPWTPVVAVGSAVLVHDDAGLAPATTYWYRVGATSSAGVTGSFSVAASVTTLPAAPSTFPAAPTFPAVTASSVTVAWTAVSGATTYELERAPDVAGVAGSWIALATTVTQGFADAGLAPNTRYWYRVRGVTAGGRGPYSPPSAVTTAPNPPGALTIASVTATTVALSWTEPAGGAARYELERAPSSLGPWGGAIPVAGRTYTDAGLPAGGTSWYRVRAVSADGWASAPCPARSATTLPLAPGAPTFSAVGSTSVTVAWGPAEGAARYTLERAAGASSAFTVVASGIAGTSFTDAALSANATSWYRVSAVNSAGAPGPYSPAASVATLPAAPGAPTFSAITATGVAVAWTAPAGGAASYRVERATASGGAWTVAAASVTALTLTDGGLAAGTSYLYRVLALGAAGAAGPASAIRVVTTAADESAPPGPVATAPTFPSVETTTITVEWASAIGAAAYRVERSTGAGDWVPVAAVTVTRFTDAGRSPNARYRYRVRATNAAGDGPWSPEASVVTTPATPAAPTFGAVAATSVAVSWAPPAGGAAAYTLERATSILGPWSTVVTGTAALALTDTPLTGTTTYLYRVRGLNLEGRAGAFSPPGTVRTAVDPTAAVPAAPGAPTFSSVLATSLRVGWSPPAGASAYEVERAVTDAGTWATVATTSGTAWTDAGTTANTVHRYRVRASAAGGLGPWSPEGRVVTAPNAPGAPTFAPGPGGAVVASWTAPDGGAATYDLERAAASTGPWTLVATAIATTTATDAGAAANATWWYRVRARNAAGLAGYYSAARSVTTAVDAGAPPPAAPDAPAYTSVLSTSLRVYWAAPAGAASFELQRAPGSVTGPGSWTTIASALVSPSWFDVGRAPNTRYWYRVRASGAGGASAFSSASSVETAPDAPGAPTFAAVASTSVTVLWSAPAGGAASYHLERATASYGPWVRVASGVTTTRFDDTGLLPGTPHFYRVRAVNLDGLDGVVSPTATVVTAPAPATPIAGAPGVPVFTDVRASSLALSWSAGAAATSYKVERGAAPDGPFTQVASVTATAFADALLAANTPYWYRIRGVNGAGDGLASDAARVTTAPGVPGAPTFGAIGPSSVTVGWTAPASGAATYALERAASVTGPWTEVASGLTAREHVDGGLAAASTWHYRVRAANAEGTYGGWSVVRSVTTAAAPAM